MWPWAAENFLSVAKTVVSARVKQDILSEAKRSYYEVNVSSQLHRYLARQHQTCECDLDYMYNPLHDRGHCSWRNTGVMQANHVFGLTDWLTN